MEVNLPEPSLLLNIRMLCNETAHAVAQEEQLADNRKVGSSIPGELLLKNVDLSFYLLKETFFQLSFSKFIAGHWG